MAAVFDVRRLLVLQEVARCGSLSAAATALNYTTSAVSQQISALERELGVAVLVRGPGGAVPTPAGTRLLEHAATILGAVAAAERDLRQGPNAAPDQLRVASFASAAALILAPALARFRVAYPGVRLRLVPADPEDGVVLLRHGGADVAVVTEVPGDAPAFPGLLTIPVYEDEFVVMLPRTHRLAGAPEVDLAALAGDEWVVSSATGTCPDSRVFRKACERAGFIPSVTFTPEDHLAVQGLVAAGLGVSLVPSLAVRQNRDDVVVRRVSGRPPVRRVALALRHSPRSGTALAVLVAMVGSVGERSTDNRGSGVPASSFSVV